MTTQGGTSDAAFRKLMGRLFLRPRYGPEPLLLIGELPPEWGIPLPQGAVIVGSYVPVEFHAQVVLDMPGEPEQAVAAVEQALTSRGWRSQQHMRRMRGGFVPAGATVSRVARLLCDDQRRRHLDVAAGPGEGGLAGVRFTLNNDPDRFAICEGDGRMHRDPMSVFPALSAPPGMSQRGSGGGSSHSHTTLWGELPVDAVERHSREQLIAAGWRLGQHAASGRWAWSAWDFLGYCLIGPPVALSVGCLAAWPYGRVMTIGRSPFPIVGFTFRCTTSSRAVGDCRTRRTARSLP
jgi:hypothetical protein